MQTFKNLFIDVGGVGIVEYIKIVTGVAGDLWSRSYESEENSKYLGEVAYCFRRAKDSSLPGAGLSIFQKEDNIWYVTNIVPTEAGQLTYKQYNDLLTEFYESCLIPATIGSNVEVTITSGDIDDADIVGTHAAGYLDTFSACANKSTGSSHPRDQERWFAFIVEACKSGKYIDIGNLKRLLQQQGWSETASQELIKEFEYARDLIKYMEK